MSIFGSNIEESVAEAIYGVRPEYTVWAELDAEAQQPYIGQARAALEAMRVQSHLLDREHIVDIPYSQISNLVNFLERPNGSFQPVTNLKVEATGGGVLVRTFPWKEQNEQEEAV